MAFDSQRGNARGGPDRGLRSIEEDEMQKCETCGRDYGRRHSCPGPPKPPPEPPKRKVTRKKATAKKATAKKASRKRR